MPSSIPFRDCAGAHRPPGPTAEGCVCCGCRRIVFDAAHGGGATFGARTGTWLRCSSPRRGKPSRSPQAYRWCAAHRRWRNSSTIDWQVPHVRGPRRCQSLSLAFASWCCRPQWLGEGSPHRQSLVSPAHWLHNQGVPQT
jgi:hypothetical protein